MPKRMDCRCGRELLPIPGPSLLKMLLLLKASFKLMLKKSLNQSKLRYKELFEGSFFVSN